MVDSINPTDYIISRKRKKYRFALFATSDNCFELDEWQMCRATYCQGDPVCIEVGAGTGLFLVELALRHPMRLFIALDVKADRLQKGARYALEKKIHNIVFVRARADQLLDVVDQNSVQDIWLTFSDPFPKKRDAKNRLTHPRFLELYKNVHVLKNAQLYLKTDSRAFFDWSIEQLSSHGWRCECLSYDLHISNLPDEYKIMTTYEKKWIARELPILFLKARAIS